MEFIATSNQKEVSNFFRFLMNHRPSEVTDHKLARLRVIVIMMLFIRHADNRGQTSFFFFVLMLNNYDSSTKNIDSDRMLNFFTAMKLYGRIKRDLMALKRS